ncbi:GNAT family N-acetyltransferase [Pseudochryseolinea flava]|uniref:GNAT family N-acetyltransferase n=1 Tax=Pseudochryseolinea flava TaxID=2059302 RepID=A0A364XUP1_9BACT|nr:GNAT family N-acetyltransferase [Pseudochryseolinea flava]RAV97978.1 GNAT family N-acetyltransferase [Pseudochryseolinea flava]
MTNIQIANSDDDIVSCWETMSLLRPMLQRDGFVKQIRDMQREGYVLLFIRDQHVVVSVAGYRIFPMLHCGKMLYIDDLSTLQGSRGKGYASILLAHLYTVAKQENCQSIQLDSGPTRTTAHRLYLQQNFIISAFHFSRML